MVNQRIVLIIANANDSVIQFFMKRLGESQSQIHKFRLLDQRRFAQDVHLCDAYWWCGHSEKIAHEQVAGVWNRMVDQHSEDNPSAQAIETFATYLMNSVYPSVLNRPMAGLSNHAKLYQIDLLQLTRLQKIDSLMAINSTPRHLGLSEDCIYKSASGVRSIVQKLQKDDQDRWISEPVLFQAFIEGINIRVHVIDQEVVACYCKSQAVDYRYAQKTEIKRIEIPAWLVTECIDISKQLGLVFTGIDLLFKDASYYLLEVNPAPGYAYFDIDGKITNALANYFTSLCKR